MSEPPASSLDASALFPPLGRLARGRRRAIPFVRQREAADCGAACLAMVIAYAGRDVTLDEVREAIGVSARDGVDALALARAGEWYGLRSRGIALDVGAMRYLPTGAVLHWDHNHFVVFDRVSRRGVHVVDPRSGPRVVDADAFSKSFTGVALVFEPGERFEPRRLGRGRLRWYIEQLSSQRHVLSRIVVMSALLRVLALALPIATAAVVDRVVPRGDHQLLVVIGAGIAALLVFQLVAALVRAHLLLQLCTNLDTRLTLGFVDYLSRLPYSFFQRRTTGDLLARVNNNATLRELLTTTALSTLLDGLLVLGYGIVVVAIAPSIGALIVVLAALQIALFYATRRRYRDLMATSLEAQARSQSQLVEMIQGIETLKATASEPRAVERWSNSYVDELNAALERGRLAAWVDALGAVLATGSPLVVLAIGAVQVMNGGLALGEMLAVDALAIGMLSPLQAMVASALQLQLVGSYMDRVDDVLATEPEQRLGDIARAPRLTGRIVIEHVGFRYAASQPLVVRDVSLDIAAGATVAIVGRSGSGKSTLARILSGLLSPTEGRVLFDGHDAARLELSSLRRQIGAVFQNPSLFSGSIRSAIALAAPHAGIDRIRAAARLAAIDDDIQALPMGYDTVLADGGASLSGGQRQRIALARALVIQPAIAILDEATSALDGETERIVIENLATLSCTRIVLAHRLSTVADADVIVVMDRGEIAEIGPHAQLLARGGHYARLVRSQLRAEGTP